MLCGAFHPENIEITCRLPQGNHSDHLGGFAPDVVMWPNDDHVAPHSGDPLPLFQRSAARIPSMKKIEERSPYLNG